MGCGPAHASRGVRPRPRSGPSEWNIVVEIVLLAARARWAGVLGIGIRRRAATATTTGSAATASPAAAVGRAGTATTASAASASATSAAATAAEHLQLIPDDFGRE